MSAYNIAGRGPQFPNGYKQRASTAKEALNHLWAARKLCGFAEAQQEDGVVISEQQLVILAAQEDQEARRKLDSADT